MARRESGLKAALSTIESWPAPNAAVAAVAEGDQAVCYGSPERVFRWASVTKLISAYAMLVAAEEGVLDLDEPAGPPGSTVRHLLAHASGLPFEGEDPIGPPGRRRVYSNTGYRLLGALLEARAEMPLATYLQASVLDPLRMESTILRTDEPQGLAAAGAYGPLADLLRFVREVRTPQLVARETLREATSIQFPGLVGVLPGIGRQDPCDWGLGFELRDAKSPHWTGTRNSPRTFGHYGGAGTFVWVDPGADVALVCLTDLEFGPWALQAWPALSDAVLHAAEQ